MLVIQSSSTSESPAESTRYGWFSYPDYANYRDHSLVFSGLAAHCVTSLNLSATEQPARVSGAMVSGNYFAALGVKAAIGRTILPEEDRAPGSNPVAVLSYEIWKLQFHSDRNVVGKVIKLNGHSFTVVGVAPEAFKGTSLEAPSDIWLPLSMEVQLKVWEGKLLTDRGLQVLSLTGRLKPGVTLKQAEAAMNVLALHLEQAYPKTNKGQTVTLLPVSRAKFWPGNRAGIVPLMGLLQLAVGLILLIACANIANLLLARGTGRHREMGIRLTLGASRPRVIRQLLTESLVMSLLGGALAFFLAYWTIDLLSFRLFTIFPLTLKASLDSRVFVFTLLVALLTGLVFGLAPAVQASKPDLISSLKDAVSTGGLRKSRLRSLLVVFQISLSLMLLIGTGLFVRSLQKEMAIDLGFRLGNTLLMRVNLEAQGYTDARGKRFYEELAQRLAAIRGVKSVSLAAAASFSDERMGRDVFVEEQGPQREKGTFVDANVVAVNYFQTMGIPLLAGRDFSDRDREGAPGVVIINQTMAHHFWPGQDPIGRRLRIDDRQGRYFEVIGVVKDGKYYDLHEEPLPYLYLPLLQNYKPWATLYVSTVGDPKMLVSQVRSQILALDRDLPVFNIKTLSESVGIWLARGKMSAALFTFFGVLALVLAAVGIYGTVAYSVAQRTGEIGVRLALGAQQNDVLKMIVGQGMKLILLGLAFGLLAGVGLTRFIASQLYGVSATDAVTFIVVSLLLVGAALLACYIPARRATKVDPMVALRYE